MTEALRNTAVDTTSLDGLDDFLATPDTEKPVLSQVHADDWTIEEAADYLKVSTKTIRRHLASGKIQGYKVAGPNGQEWRIPQTSLDNHTRQDHPETIEASTVQATVESKVDTTLVDVLQTELERLRKENEALIYRTGYLQAQVEHRDGQIKLLVDAQATTRWWDRMCSWFKGR